MKLRKNRVAATAALVASAVVALAAIAGCGSRIPRTSSGPNAGQTRTAVSTPSQPPAQGQVQTSQPPLAAGQLGTLGQVPWGEVGPGWALAEYTTGTTQVPGPVALYMLDPEGGMYQLYRWPATTQQWILTAWSGDKTRVLLQHAGASGPTLQQLTIATGQITTFTLPATVTAVLGYTSPDGENVLVDQDGVVRYSLTGVLQARLSDGPDYASAVSSPNGLSEVVSGGTGVELVSNAGGLVRFLPVPGTNPATGGCRPVRWWNAADMLVSCQPDPGPSMFSAARLWLVPVSGAPPTALTPQRPASSGDMGDDDAWQLPTGLYVEAEAGCGPPYVAKELPGTAVQLVSPASVVIATSGDRMLIQKSSECVAGSSLAWLDSAASSSQPVLTASPNSAGVIAAIAFDGDGEQPS